jgi:hypothetical protein
VPPKKQGKSYGNPPKPKRIRDVFNLSNKEKFLDFWKDSMSLAQVG